VAVVLPVSALPVAVGADCTWVCMEATVALSERTSSLRALRQFCKEAMAACWLDEVHDGHRKGLLGVRQETIPLFGHTSAPTVVPALANSFAEQSVLRTAVFSVVHDWFRTYGTDVFTFLLRHNS